MKIKLNYTADVGDIPGEVSFIIKNLHEMLAKNSPHFIQLNTNLEGSDYDARTVIDGVDHIRRSLAKIDLRLMETLDMIRAYEEYLDPPSPTHPEENPSEIEKEDND